MNIYIVSHYWDNGETYPEDYTDYRKHYYYSSLELAQGKYYGEILKDYEGQWEFIEKTLDTQEENIIEKSPWVKCSPWDGYYPDYDSEDNEEYEELDLYEESWDSHASFYSNDSWKDNYDKALKELEKDANEWLVHKGDNFKNYAEITKDEIDDMCKELAEPSGGGIGKEDNSFYCVFWWHGSQYYAELLNIGWTIRAAIKYKHPEDYDEDYWVYDEKVNNFSEHALIECIKEFLCRKEMIPYTPTPDPLIEDLNKALESLIKI